MQLLLVVDLGPVAGAEELELDALGAAVSLLDGNHLSAELAGAGPRLLLIGHTDNLAWSHTVSTAYRFTPFEEKLVPGSPTTYVQDGQQKQMKADDVTVMVKNRGVVSVSTPIVPSAAVAVPPLSFTWKVS